MTDHVRHPAGRCCIGVLLDSMGVPHYPSAAVPDQEAYFISCTGMPDSAWSASVLGLGYDEDAGQVWLLDVEGSGLWLDRANSMMDTDLAEINDHYGLTHAQHADLIRYFGLVGDPEKVEVPS